MSGLDLEPAADAAKKPAWLRWGAAAGGVALALLIALGLRSLLTGGAPPPPMKVQQITLMRPPPPPPPPPEQQPPEPELKEEVKVESPEPAPEPQQADAPPPGPDLGVDVDGSGAGDGFGLVGKKGGAELAGSGGGNPWAWFDAQLTDAANDAVQKALAREEALKHKNYRVIVRVWVDASGRVARAQLAESTGDARADDVLKAALAAMRPLRQGPPADMPQPLKIRVVSRA